MQYPNAESGIKRIYSGQILELIGIALGILGVAGLAVLGLVGLVLIILGFVRMTLGTLEAGKDDDVFKTASIFVIANIILYVAAHFLSGGILGLVLGLAKYAAMMFSVYFIALGISSVASKIGNLDMAEYAKGRGKLLVIIYAIILVGTVASVIPAMAEIAGTLVGIIALAGAVVYLLLLNKAQKMF